MGFVLKYVLRNGSGRLSFRRAYPANLRPFIPAQPREFKVSLGNEGGDGVMVRYEQARHEYEQVIASAQRREQGAFDVLDAPTIAYLAAVHRHQILAEDDEARYDPSDTDFYLEVRKQLDADGVGIAVSPFCGDPVGRWSNKHSETIQELREACLNMRKRGDVNGLVEFWRDDAGLLCEDKGLCINFDDAGPLRQLCRALNDAALSAWDGVLQRLDGDDVPTPPEPLPEAIAEDGGVCQSSLHSAPVRAVTSRPAIWTCTGFAPVTYLTMPPWLRTRGG